MKINAAAILVGVFVATMYTGIVYSVGKSSGEATIQTKWDAESKKRDAKTSEIEGKNTQLEADNKALSDKITKDLTDHEKAIKTAIAGVHREYAQRMYHSEAREGIYREQAAGTAAERDALASHAAKLDRALEEGRFLVFELRSTLGLRESQIRLIAAQLMADRALLK